jgi:hypothetical protein
MNIKNLIYTLAAFGSITLFLHGRRRNRRQRGLGCALHWWCYNNNSWQWVDYGEAFPTNQAVFLRNRLQDAVGFLQPFCRVATDQNFACLCAT